MCSPHHAGFERVVNAAGRPHPGSEHSCVFRVTSRIVPRRAAQMPAHPDGLTCDAARLHPEGQSLGLGRTGRACAQPCSASRPGAAERQTRPACITPPFSSSRPPRSQSFRTPSQPGEERFRDSSAPPKWGFDARLSATIETHSSRLPDAEVALPYPGDDALRMSKVDELERMVDALRRQRNDCDPKSNSNARYLRYSNAVSALLWIIHDLRAEEGS